MRKYLIPTLAALCLVVFAWAQTTRVGPLPSADSLAINQRVGRTGETITQPSGGVNKERVRRQACYYSEVQAGVAPGTTIGTTAALVLYNPQNSGVLLSVSKTWCAFTSGTLGQGTLFHAMNTSATQTAPSGGTLQPVRNAQAGAPNVNVGICRSGATVVAPDIYWPFMSLPGGFTITSITPLQPSVEVIDDSIQLLPGTSYQMQSSAGAGTSPLLYLAVMWEEQALLNGQP